MIDVQLGFTGDDSPCSDSCDLWSHSMLEPSEWTIQHTLRCETCPRMAGHLVTRTLLVLRDEGSLTFCHHLQFPEKNASQTMPICKMISHPAILTSIAIPSPLVLQWDHFCCNKIYASDFPWAWAQNMATKRPREEPSRGSGKNHVANLSTPVTGLKLGKEK